MTLPGPTLHVTNAWHPSSGGVKTVYDALLKAASGRRRLAVVVPDDHDDDEHIAAGVTVYHVKAPRSPWIDRRYRLILPHQFLLGRRMRLAAILERERPQLVEITDKLSLCYLAGWLRTRPVAGLRPVLVGFSAERFDNVLAVHMPWLPAAARVAPWFMRRIYAPMFDYHLANSPFTAHEVSEALESHRKQRIAWVPLGVDTETFAPERRDEGTRLDLLRRTGGSAQSLLVVTAARLSREKQIDRLAEAVSLVVHRHGRDARLVVVGDGPERAALEQTFAERLAGRACFIGHVSDRRRLARIEASADVFAHPNAAEPYGIGPLEAMASGVAVVVPASGGVLAYASARNAWLFAAGAEAFAEAIVGASTPGPDRDARLAQARATAHALAWPLVADRLFSAYDALIAARVALTQHVAPRAARPERFCIDGTTNVTPA